MQEELSEEKDMILEEADRAQHEVRDTQKEVDKLDKLIEGERDIYPVSSESSADDRQLTTLREKNAGAKTWRIVSCEGGQCKLINGVEKFLSLPLWYILIG